MVRRLPVLQNTEADGETRPAWHYVLIGAGFTVTLWLPLAMLALAVGPSLALWVAQSPPSEPGAWGALMQTLPLLLSFFLACFASGTLVGRFGGRAGRREAILANLSGSALVLVLALSAGNVPKLVTAAAAAFLCVSSVLGGWGGGLLGLRLRPGAQKLR